MNDSRVFDKRYKYRLKEQLPFYIYIRNKQNKIYYVRYKNGKTVSTKTSSLKRALNFAQVFFYTYTNEQKSEKKSQKNQKLSLNTILVNYYVAESEFVEYDLKHGTKYPNNTLNFNHSRMKKIALLLKDVQYPEDLTRNRLIKLQDELLKSGLSGKTVNNYFSIFKKIYNQLLDKEIVKNDPFANLRPCSFQKELRLCFPLEKIKGAFANPEDKYLNLAFVACGTGMRRSEIERIQKDDFIIKNGQEWLKVRGTKSVYSVREVPVFPELKKAILKNIGINYNGKEWADCVEVLGQKIGFDKEYIKNNGIKFHSFRKTYKTLLTQANLNSTLIEMLMGHTTQNQMSNDVERIYFVAESADLTKVWEKVTSELQYLI